MRHQALLSGLVVILTAGMLSAQAGSRSPQGQSSSPVVVRVETTLGNIDIAVDTAHAPITSANFLRYVSGAFYDGGEFYRAARPDTYHAVLPNRPPMELIEARIPADKKAYPPIPLERTSVSGLHHVVGTVAMGRNDDQPDSATDDFYILLNDQPSLDFGGKRFNDAQGTAPFGTVTAGLDVVRKINQQPVAARAATADNPLTKTQNLDPPIRITRVYRVQPPGSHRAGFTSDIRQGPPTPPPPPPSTVQLGANMIGGAVYEITRAPLAGATVTLIGPTRNVSRVATTGTDGTYKFANVAPGKYQLTVEWPGFKKAVRTNIVMAQGHRAQVDCMLERSGSH